MLVAAPPGGSPDVVARILAEGLSRRRGNPISVENRPGADGAIAAEAFARARPGDALFFMFGDMLTTAAMLQSGVPFDPIRDFVPISTAADDLFVVSAAPALPARSLGELVAHARERPAGLNWFASPGPPWLAFRAFLRSAGLDMAYVSYRGAPPALLDLAAGRIQVALTPLAPAAALARDGRIRLIAVPGRERAPSFPEAPTSSEAGWPALLIQGLLGLVGWRDIPEDLREEIAEDVRQILADPATVVRLAAAGLVARSSTPAQYAAELAGFAARWDPLVREFGARPPG
jgi:tripartite-type tricarboxylate transporter receptor subunit TctC